MSQTLIGKSLDRYTVTRLLGQGGMGAVYEGTDTQSGARVAIKVMTRGVGEDAELVRRFQREAQIAGGINHPNVARVLAIGVEDDARFLVMEFIEGRSLYDILKEKGHLSGSRCLDYIRQTALGLQAAQDQGSIHRDVKPENLMLTPEDQIKIVDFGLAKNENSDSFKTATGAVMGTPHYISPEQATGRPVDHRSDIYSLGATFYHLLTGHTPYSGENAIAIIQKHMREEVRSIRHWSPNVPEPVCQVVYRMLRKNPDDRFQTYGHLIQVLDDVMHGRESPSMTMEVVDEAEAHAAATQTQKDRKRLMKLGAAIGGVIVVAAALAFMLRSRPAKESANESPESSATEQASGTDRFAPISKEKWRSETMPLLHDIDKHNREMDDDSEKFESRRERMNRGSDSDN